MSDMFLLAQGDGGSGAFGFIILLIQLAVIGLILASLWIVFTKAGKPGWAAIIPIYNAIVLLEIAGKPIWWVILLLIPCVNIFVAVLIFIDLAKSFGQSPAFGIGLWLLGFIFFPILAFGDAKYIGPPTS